MIHLPILLIHGFNGAPTDWTGDKDRFVDFLVAHDYDPDLIRVFDYGYEEFEGTRTYNNTGDVREIARRLADADGEAAANCSIDLLSRDSLARGGPEQVTVIAHSLGGLVTRYYLSCRHEDDLGTLYRGNVARLITLGTPHHGVDYLHTLDPFPASGLLYRAMARLHFLLPPEYLQYVGHLRTHVRKMHHTTKEETYGRGRPPALLKEMPAFLQMRPDSVLLRQINRKGAMPNDVQFFTLFGDIHAQIRFNAFKRTFIQTHVSLGDLIIPALSASTIPNVRFLGHPIIERHTLHVDLGGKVVLDMNFTDSNPNITPTHTNLRRHPEARQKILDILSASQP